MYMYVYVCMYVFTIDTKLLVIVCIFFLEFHVARKVRIWMKKSVEVKFDQAAWGQQNNHWEQ